MGKSVVVAAMDGLLRRLKPELVRHGFRMRGRAFNRVKPDGLVDVIDIMMGAQYQARSSSYVIRGPLSVAGNRADLYGLFSVNIGIYVPECARWQGRTAGFCVHDYNCSIKFGIGDPGNYGAWWGATDCPILATELNEVIVEEALPFFRRFQTRDHILREIIPLKDNTKQILVPRILSAIILAERGDAEKARKLLAAQARDNAVSLPHHAAYVRQLAERMGISIDAH